MKKLEQTPPTSLSFRFPPHLRVIKGGVYAFTLVELIVVITILAILGTIAFLSFNGYNSNARDGARTSDLSNISKGLEIYRLKTGNYPLPTSYTGITYSGGLAWTQGTLGLEVGNISKLPLDPLTNNPYTYSVTANGKEFQVAGVYEGSISKNNSDKKLFNKSYADGNLSGLAKIVGNYNGVSLKVLSGSTTYILAVPSIISSDLSSSKLIDIINNKKLVYNGLNNLPSSYSGTKFKIDGKVDLGLNLNNILVYSGSYDDLISSGGLMLSTLNKIQNSYSGSILKSYPTYTNLLQSNSSNSLDLANLLITGITNNPNILDTINNTNLSIYNCASIPTISNLGTTTIGTPTSVNKPWTYSATPGNCTYNCINGYSGNNCSTPPTLSCASIPTISNLGTTTIGTPTSVNQSWTYSATPGNCTYNCINGYSGNNCSTPPTLSCNPGYHAENNSCVSNTRSCTVQNGVGTETWGGSGNWSGYCYLDGSSCNSGYHTENNSCVSNTRTCTIPNGIGTETWSSYGGNSYYGAYGYWPGNCVYSSCNSGYNYTCTTKYTACYAKVVENYNQDNCIGPFTLGVPQGNWISITNPTSDFTTAQNYCASTSISKCWTSYDLAWPGISRRYEFEAKNMSSPYTAQFCECI